MTSGKLISRALLPLCLLLLAIPLAGQPAAPPQPAAGATNRLLVVAPRAFHPALETFLAYKQTRLAAEFSALEDILQ